MSNMSLRKKRIDKIERVFKEIMTRKFQELVIIMNLQIQKTQHIPKYKEIQT